jgi:hypothetical protein
VVEQVTSKLEALCSNSSTPPAPKNNNNNMNNLNLLLKLFPQRKDDFTVEFYQYSKTNKTK